MRGRLFLIGIVALAACRRGMPTNTPIGTLRARELAAIAVPAPSPAQSFRWPRFFLAENPTTFLWGEGRLIFRLSISAEGQVSAQQVFSEMTDGLGMLVAAAKTSTGTITALDADGRVGIMEASGKVWRFNTHLKGRIGDIAAWKDRVYLLLQGRGENRSAVIAYDFFGKEINRWSEIPPDGIIQASLKGGGITSCPDGVIFYNYINSPQPMELQAGESVKAWGSKFDFFREVTESQVQDAFRASKRGSVGPLIRLGLSSGRVMAIRCSDEGFLVRQVARPGGEGVEIQILDRRIGDWVGKIAVQDGILLDVKGRTLYLGTSPKGRGFTLKRVVFDPSSTQTRSPGK